MSKEIKSAALVGVFFFIVFVGALWYVKQTQDEKETLEGTVAGLTAEIGKLEAKVAKLEGLRKELRSIEENLSNYIKILPSPQVATVERLMDLVQEKSERAQFAPNNFRIKRDRRRRKKSRSAFQEIDVTLNASGTYEQFLNFLNSLERHETFLRVNSFSCSGGAPKIDENNVETWPLNIALNVSTFRYEAGK